MGRPTKLVMSGKLDGYLENERASFDVFEDGQKVASVDGPIQSAMSNAMHYASQYAQDGGKVEVRRVKTRKADF